MLSHEGRQRPIVPAALVPGARIRVIAPSGPFDRTLALRGIGWLAQRYRVEFAWDCFASDGFLAGSDDRRLLELNEALACPDLSAIVAARGGYGLTRIVHRADWTSFGKAPKWIVGFSDITALHVEAMARGVASLHAENVAGLGRGDARARARWVEALEAPTRIREIRGLSPLQSGHASGILAGGNLSLLFTCAAAGRLHLPEGAVLVIEDVTEAAYRVDRMLSALLASGALDRIGAVVVGDFTDCPPSRGTSVEQVLTERLCTLRVPILSGLHFGHGLENEPLVLGLPTTVDADSGTLTLGR
ncbi:MAG TPA: LD-carboxypeptidase [Polyangiaceae bacterium]|nr:LD-carboxypeptidase [Polyangiaceae bacterium]